MPNIDVGSIIKDLRNALGMSSEQYAALYGVVPQTIERWIEGIEPAPEDVATVLEGMSKSIELLPRVASELSIVRSLVERVTDKIRNLELSNRADLMVYQRAFEQIQDDTPQLIRDHLVLQRQAYGRVVKVRDLDNEKEITFRIAWGACSYTDLNVYSRNAPLVAKLMPARVGDEIEVKTPGGTRNLEVLEVTLLQRYTDESLSGNLDNFASGNFGIDAQNRPLARLEDLRGWVNAIREWISDSLRARQPVEEDIVGTPEVPALTEDSRAALSDRFFMDPLGAQEEIMAAPADGHVLVEGVAGSGKTSVALGRAAMICMERTDDGQSDRFRPETGIGYVLSDQLVSYLAGLLRGNLNLEKMPVQSYFALRQKLIGVRELLPRGVRRADPESGAQDPVVGCAAWFAAVEEMAATRILDALLRALPTDPRNLLQSPSSAVTPLHWEAITSAGPRNAKEDLWAEFRRRLPSAFGVRSARDVAGLSGVLEAVDGVRATFADRLEVLSPWDSPKLRDDRRKISARIRAAIEAAFSYAERYFEVVADPGFQVCLERHMVATSRALDAGAVRAALDSARTRAGGRSLSNADIDMLLLVAHSAAEGYRGRDNAKPIGRLAELPFHSHVFIDEVQDFSEVQVRLMAAQASPKHRSVTAVGDFSQRLARGGLTGVERSGLSLGGSRTIFLGWNKRQTAPLHALASAFRMEVQGDLRACQGEPPRDEDERPFRLGVGDSEVINGLRQWLTATREQRRHYTMAVLCPSVARAAELESHLHEELWALNILTRATNSQTDAAKLCDAFYVHFTTPQHAKGLEFDAVFATDVDTYDLSDPTQQGALYVALTRGCRRLGIGLQGTPSAPLAKLFDAHLTMAPDLS
jgi:transcription elongation GreA/GreB family factor